MCIDKGKAGLLKINEDAWAKVPVRCINDMDVRVGVGVYAEEAQEEKHDTNIRILIGGASGHSARISRAWHFPPRMVL